MIFQMIYRFNSHKENKMSNDIDVTPEEAKSKFPYLEKLSAHDIGILLTDIMRFMITKDECFVKACMCLARTKAKE